MEDMTETERSFDDPIRIEGETKTSGNIVLHIDVQCKSYCVIHYELCGYDTVEYTFKSALEAVNFFNALLPVVQIEED